MRTVDRVRAVPKRWWQRLPFRLFAASVLLAAVAFVIAAEYILHNAEPILRKRIIETLSARFDAPVELDRVEISLFRGIEVNGYGLRISYPSGSSFGGNAMPMISVEHFAFRTSLHSLFHQPTRVAAVRVDGMDLHIPPARDRKAVFASRRDLEAQDGGIQPRIAITVSELQCRSVRLFLESGKPGKIPLEFDIASLDMQDVGKQQAMRYDAVLTNAKPIGQIHAIGHFGPWGGVPPETHSRAEGDAPLKSDAAQTPIDGTYTFDHADLNTIKGIGGTLSSTGRFAGVLNRITIDGDTDTPDFSLDISNRPVPLHTHFHAIVDGTTGDTWLQPVQARLAGSDFTTSGKIVKVKGAGHDIALTIDIPHGRMQDFLRLAVKTNPPLMNGLLTLKANLHIPPGDVRVPEKLAMQGTAQLTAVRFNNPKLQDRIDGLSARAQGRPRDVSEVSHDRDTEVNSALAANFSIGHGVAEVTDVRYAIPGALVLLNGVYSMDGKLFEFKGRVRTDATASQMVGGWKGLFLSPLDSLLKKNGAGVELPIEISGTEGDMHFGLALHGTDQSPSEMLKEVKGKQHAQQQLRSARDEAAQANQDDLAAAHATTLEAAEAAHNRAVRRRAEAQSRAAAVRNNPDTTTVH